MSRKHAWFDMSSVALEKLPKVPPHTPTPPVLQACEQCLWLRLQVEPTKPNAKTPTYAHTHAEGVLGRWFLFRSAPPKCGQSKRILQQEFGDLSFERQLCLALG